MYSKPLPRSTPGKEGVNADGIIDFINAIERDAIENNAQELHSFMLLRHGKVIAEGWWKPYEAEMPHMLFSLSKSFTSTAIGMLVNEGIISIDDRVCSFFDEELPEKISDNLAAMKIRHLLTMSTGHAEETMNNMRADLSGNWVKGFLNMKVEFEPGTHFFYNTGATYMLSAILQKKTGQTLVEYLTPRLFEPIGISNPTWEKCPKGINTGGFGLSITTEDIAKFGQLNLQKGFWEGRNLIPEEWVTEATKKQIDNGNFPDSDWSQGYGYQFWRCRNNLYRGDGAFGQYCIVMPEQDVIIAITGAVSDMQLPLNHIYKYILPSIGNETLPDNLDTEKFLKDKLRNLSVYCSHNDDFKEGLGVYSGKCYKFADNPANPVFLKFDKYDAGYKIEVGLDGDRFELIFSTKEWMEADNSLREFILKLNPNSQIPLKVLLKCSVIRSNTLEIILRFIETPFYQKVQLCFGEDKLSLTARMNVGFEKPEPMTIMGVADKTI